MTTVEYNTTVTFWSVMNNIQERTILLFYIFNISGIGISGAEAINMSQPVKRRSRVYIYLEKTLYVISKYQSSTCAHWHGKYDLY